MALLCLIFLTWLLLLSTCVRAKMIDYLRLTTFRRIILSKSIIWLLIVERYEDATFLRSVFDIVLMRI